MKDGIHPHGDASMYRRAKKKQTNADRIRAMSNEELAEFFISTNCCPFEIDDTVCSSKLNCNNCAVYIKKWLQSESYEKIGDEKNE